MSKGLIHVSDSIGIHSINTGGQTVGNGGNGIFSGDVSNAPTLNFQPHNTAVGSDVHVTTGDHVGQTADWQAGGANATAALLANAHGGTATSSGDQSSNSGHDTSSVIANTSAVQSNHLTADMYQEVMAGIGGNGGSDNAALGGEVDFHFGSSV